MKQVQFSLLVLAVILIAGCAKDTALFVTRTSLGIDLESKPPVVSLAYDRTEGFYGPRYDNGAVPPVVGSVRTDGTVLTPRIRQTYATGRAAKIVTSENMLPEDLPLEGDLVRPMFFGTSTTLGFKVGFSTATGMPVPDSVTFGYKRKEASYIPLGTVGNQHKYPSVLAAIDTDSGFKEFQGAKNNTVQFFASGYAAEALAQKPEIKRLLIDEAKQAIGSDPIALAKARTEIASANAKAVDIGVCVSGATEQVDTALLDSLLNKAGMGTGPIAALKRKTKQKDLITLLQDEYDQSVDSVYNSLDQIQCVSR